MATGWRCQRAHAEIIQLGLCPWCRCWIYNGQPVQPGDPITPGPYEALKRRIHGKLVDELDLARVQDLEGEALRRELRLVVERLCDTENPLLYGRERERLVLEIVAEIFS